MQDLSHILPSDPVTALAPTSQAGGNVMSSNNLVGTAPGSQPVDPLPPAKDQGEPKVIPSNSTQIKTGTTGKRKPSASYSAPKPSWGKAGPAAPERTPEN